MTSNNDYPPCKIKQEQKCRWYQSFFQTIEHFYMQFLLVTTLYVMEPWERLLMITIFLLIISLFTYSAIVYIPFHVHNILQSTMPSIKDIILH
ncbi:unnamed protein product [Adineta steineri]|uniref:Serine palmitoyltransferase small subunit B n=1 Tax=Adineta steineri TaxID=433720 RepID=A0A814UBP1_9BILA|nr:unnamed protein product [Adineta steineri]